MACSGIEKHVKDRQRATGVKDAYTQYWINDLIKRARSMKIEHPEMSDEEIETELVSWADANAEIIYNPFFTLRGGRSHHQARKMLTHAFLRRPRSHTRHSY